MLSDRELLARYVDCRDEDAFAELVRRHVNLAYGVALRTLNGDTHRAKDITQTVFVRLANRASSLERNVVLAGWIHTTAHHAACNAVRSDVRRRRWETEAHMEAARSSIDPPEDWQRVGPLLDEAMQELRRRDREAVLLRFFENQPYAEIGRRLGLAENTARMRVNRALETLAGILARKGVRSTATALASLLTTNAFTAAPTGLAAGVTAAALAASGTTGATLAFTWIKIMSTAKVTMTVGVVALVATGLGLQQTRQLRRSEQRHAAAVVQLAEAQRAAAALKEELQAAKATSASPQNGDGAARAAADIRAYEQEKARRLAGEAKRRAEIQETVALSPEIQQLRFQAFRVSAALRYGALYQALGIDTADTERLARLLEERFWAISDLSASGRTQGLSRDDPTFQSMLDLALAPVDVKLQALLGDSGMAQWRDYEATSDARELVERIHGKLSLAADALSTEQALGLAKIFADARLMPATEKGSWLERQVWGRTAAPAFDVGDVNWDQALPRLRTLLTPKQLVALNSLYLQQALVHRADRTMERRSRDALTATDAVRR